MIVNPWGKFKADVLKASKKTFKKLGLPPAELEKTLEEPPDQKLGDLATTVCFELARKLRKDPTKIAEELAQSIKPSGLIERVEAVGGYVNFFVDTPKLTKLTLSAVERAEANYGKLGIGRGRKIIVEHTSVNPTKPLHIGHGRNAVLGDTMARILRSLGYGVEVHNYIDDMGLQVAQTLCSYLTTKRKPKGKFDHALGKLYVEIQQRFESEPELEEKVREILGQLERGEEDLARRARVISERCVRANLETSDRLGIGYDALVWESDIAKSGILNQALESLRATTYVVKGTGELSGTLVLRLADFGIEDKVLVRSDGTAVYTARDIAYQLWKFGKTKATLGFKYHSKRPDGTKTYTTTSKGKPYPRFGHGDGVINVIGAEQKFPQQVVFIAFKALGFEHEYQNSHHMAYEHIWLPTGRFEGRLGTWVGYSVDEVIDEAVKRAYREVEKRNPKASKWFKRETAEVVGTGAVRFALLQTSPEKKIVFKWEDALNFERNSGPAIQYSHARACSILRKAKRGDKRGGEGLKLFEEKQVIKQLSKLPEVMREAGEKLQPHLLAIWAAELALRFNKFYEVAPVIEAETAGLRETRLKLVNCTRVALRNALGVLGIVAPERM